jgi:hypothetical protein
VNFFELYRLLGDLRQAEVDADALAQRLRDGADRLTDTGHDAELVSGTVDAALAALRETAAKAARLTALAAESEIVLRATVHVPSLPVWEAVRPLVAAFHDHPDWECEVTLPAEAVAEVDAGAVPVVAFEEWIEYGWLTDLSVTVLRYPDSLEEKLRAVSWAVALLPTHLSQADPAEYWQVLDSYQRPFPTPFASVPFFRRLEELAREGRTPLLWSPESYDDFFGEGVDAAGLIEEVRGRDDVVLLWVRDDEKLGAMSVTARSYLLDLMEAIAAEGTAVVVSAADFFHALGVAGGICSSSEVLLNVFDEMGRPALLAAGGPLRERFAGLVEQARAVVALEPCLTPAEASRVVGELSETFVGEFAGASAGGN